MFRSSGVEIKVARSLPPTSREILIDLNSEAEKNPSQHARIILVDRERKRLPEHIFAVNIGDVEGRRPKRGGGGRTQPHPSLAEAQG